MKRQSKIHKQKWKGRRKWGRNAKDVEKERKERSTSKQKLSLTLREGAGGRKV